MSGAPTKTNTSIVSDQDRHFIHLGTETTIGSQSTFDPMFIRFLIKRILMSINQPLLILQVHLE
jgi:hypothetical protein